MWKLLVVFVFTSLAFGQESNLSFAAGDYVNSLKPLLNTFTKSATCNEELKPKDEFETTTQYQRRLQQYAQKAERMLLNTTETFNRQNKRPVSIWFSLDQGEYDADAGVYTLKPHGSMEIYSGINIVRDMIFIIVTYDSLKLALRLKGIPIKANPNFARKLRSREQGMQVGVFFTLSARAVQARLPQYATATDRDALRYQYSIGLALVPYKLEVRDPAEAQPVIFSGVLTPDIIRDDGLDWRIQPGKHCGIN